MKKVRIGIIGLGSWGECHLEAYRSIPSAEVVAVCENRESRLKDIVRQYGIADAYTDAEAFWSRDDIDLVSVVTYEKAHLEPVMRALRGGKHVLVEKPVTTVLEEANTMVEEADRCGKIIAPGHLLRFDARYAQIHEALNNGELGKPLSIFLKRSRAKTLFSTYNRTHTVYELSVHDIDTAIWYAGSRVRSVKAYGRHAMGADVPDILWACLEFENDVIAVIESNWMTPERAGIAMDDCTEVIAEKGVAHFDTRNSGLQLWGDETGRMTVDHHIHYKLGGKVHGALKEQLEYLCECIRIGLSPERVSFADAIHGIEVAKAIEESARTGKDIIL